VTLGAGTKIGPYEVLAWLGAGGMGEVYRARDPRLGREVAIKVLLRSSEDDTRMAARFRHEAQLAGSLNHPNVLTVFDTGVYDGQLYIVSELLVGRSLRDRIGEGSVTESEARRIAVGLAEALGAAHEKGIVHRDLKPENVFLLADGRPKLLDFGIARLAEKASFTLSESAPLGATGLTVPGVVLGTPAYMSPEQIRGQPADARSDLFSFGCVLYELIGGRRPFPGGSTSELAAAILRDPPAPLTNAPPLLADIALHCMEKRPEDRFQTAREVKAALQNSGGASGTANLASPTPSNAPTPALPIPVAPAGFLDELKRRRVVRALIGYAIVAFAILQIIEPILHALHWPDSVLTAAVAVLALGFPVAATLAWVYDLTAAGLTRTVVPAGPPHNGSTAVLLSRRTLTLLGAAALSVVAVVAWRAQRESRVRWVKGEAIPQIISLIERGSFIAAVALAEQAERVDPSEPDLVKLWPQMSRNFAIETEPPGAKVSVKEYSATGVDWRTLGRSPLAGIRLSRALHRFRIVKEGFEPIEVAPTYREYAEVLSAVAAPSARLRFRLDPVGTRPEGMVRVRGGKTLVDGDPPLSGSDVSFDIDDFFLDKFEVTNRQFKQFVDAGGYRRPELWTSPFVLDGHSLSWPEAMALLHDRTGRQGPATWSSGDFADGAGDLPVTGVSWYEAAAYASWTGKSLPTVAHWFYAAGAWSSIAATRIIQASNFGGAQPTAVGSSGGLGPYGTFDMAGNVKEWCWNAAGDKRYLLGGSFDEPAYMFGSRDARPALDRSAQNGVRLAKYPDSSRIPAPLMAPLPLEAWPDFAARKPISDEVFKVYKSLYAYDHTDLGAVVELVDDSDPRWRKEKITINAAYGKERFSLWVFTPKRGRPPYQTVVHFPGSFALQLRSSERLDGLELLMFLVKSGRAVIYPVYKSTYERGDEVDDDEPQETTVYRDHVVYWVKDFQRAIDWAQTRDDFDHEKIALYGRSWGALMAPIIAAIDERIKVGLVVSAGFKAGRVLPEADPPNFAPRVHQPMLMVNGRYDFIFPHDTSQVTYLRFLGTSPEHKRLAVFEGGHRPFSADQVMKEMLEWLDHYLGQVE
jgi:tRNA A-37 threonylcarbamoyl transferase component Bud32/dienelactone hydrolase